MAVDISIQELGPVETLDLSFDSGAASQTFEFDGQDHRTIIIAENGDSEDAYLKFSAGDFWNDDQGSYLSDAIEQNDFAAFQLDSSRFKDEDGEGTVEIVDSDGSTFTGTESNVKIAVVELKTS